MAASADAAEWPSGRLFQLGRHDAARGRDRSAQRRCGATSVALVARRAVSVLGAWRNAHGQQEVDELFALLEESFSDCTSYTFELQACDVVGDMAYTAGLEHTSASVNEQPHTYTPRATQVYSRENHEWKVAHRHGDTVID